MLNVGIKKEIMFFTRSFRLVGVIIASVVFAVISPLLMSFSYNVMSGVMGAGEGNADYSDVSYEDGAGAAYDIASGGMSMDILGDMFTDEELMAKMGFLSSVGDLTNTLLLIFMLVTMYSAGGELKKRSMIIPQNAGLSPKLYILPKFFVFPLTAALLAFCGVWISFGITSLMFNKIEVEAGHLFLVALMAAVFNCFMISLYFTLGICTQKAGISVVIMYGGNTILTTLFNALGATKFHPFTLVNQCQSIITGGGDAIDNANLWGSIGVSVLLIALCYFITLFVVSAKKIDNQGVEEMTL